MFEKKSNKLGGSSGVKGKESSGLKTLDGLIRAFALLTAGLPTRQAEHQELLRLARGINRRQFRERRRERMNSK